MTMEERDRMIEERGEERKLRSQILKKLQLGQSAERIAEDLVEDLSVIQNIIQDLT